MVPLYMKIAVQLLILAGAITDTHAKAFFTGRAYEIDPSTKTVACDRNYINRSLTITNSPTFFSKLWNGSGD